MNFLEASKKANEHLLKYSVSMIHVDKPESLLLSLLGPEKAVCQTVGMFDLSSEKNGKIK